VCQKNSHKILELNTSTHPERETISTETLTKSLKNFVLHLHKFVIFRDVTWIMFSVTSIFSKYVEQSVNVSYNKEVIQILKCEYVV
jgi:hypothetical protein